MMDSKPLSAALEVLRPYLASPQPGQALIAAKCIALMRGYAYRWRDSPFLIDEVETVVVGDLYNIGTEAKSRTFRSGGKLDVRARERVTERRVLIDHKTCSQDIADPNAPYWRQLSIEGQVSHYMLLLWQQGLNVDYGLWDVLRKPSIAPKLLAKKDKLEVLATASYYQDPLSRDELSEFEAGDRETLPMYTSRLAYDCMHERPEWYLQRRQVPRLDNEIAEYAEELWGHSQDIILARRVNRHPRNSGACMNYGSPCKFLGICSGHDTPDSANWQVKAQVHVELPTLDGDGRDVLTNSRIRTFQTCRRKHFYQYELGIEKNDEEEREALWFGTLYHLGLEQFFLALKEEQKGA
jgi:hypothetical protein